MNTSIINGRIIIIVDILMVLYRKLHQWVKKYEVRVEGLIEKRRRKKGWIVKAKTELKNRK
ncbi:hypothetical protein [Tissierella praeacuta]|uniref:hypothetical protein n=1 Tax=Tissierella praeacuta TaxID=43131 RepID=UPI003341CDB4